MSEPFGLKIEVLCCSVLYSKLSFALVCKRSTVYFLVSISIHAVHHSFYESGMGLSAEMKFHIHDISKAIFIPGTRQGITYVNYVWRVGGREKASEWNK